MEKEQALYIRRNRFFIWLCFVWICITTLKVVEGFFSHTFPVGWIILSVLWWGLFLYSRRSRLIIVNRKGFLENGKYVIIWKNVSLVVKIDSEKLVCRMKQGTNCTVSLLGISRKAHRRLSQWVFAMVDNKKLM